MIDRRIGLYGHPFDIQSLFYAALKGSIELLIPNQENKNIIQAVHKRLGPFAQATSRRLLVRLERLNVIYRFQVEGVWRRSPQSVQHLLRLYSVLSACEMAARSRWLPSWQFRSLTTGLPLCFR